MKLENWKIVTVDPYGNGCTAPEQMIPCFVGNVYGDSRREDGKAIRTSQIKVLDPSLKLAATRNSVYELGEPDKEWLEWLTQNGYKLSDYVKKGKGNG